MSNFSVEAKVGVFVIIGFVILGYMSMKVGMLNFSGDKGYTIEVLFDSATAFADDDCNPVGVHRQVEVIQYGLLAK